MLKLKLHGIYKYIRVSSEHHTLLPKREIPYILPNGLIRTAKYKLVKVIKGYLFDNYEYKLDRRSTVRYLDI